MVKPHWSNFRIITYVREQHFTGIQIFRIFTVNILSVAGHLDPGESDLEAALRETQEEAGLDKDQLKINESFKKVLNYEVRGKPKIVTYWLCEIKDVNSAVTLSHEHQGYKWLNLKDALEYAKFADMQKVLNEANDFIQTSLTW